MVVLTAWICSAYGIGADMKAMSYDDDDDYEYEGDGEHYSYDDYDEDIKNWLQDKFEIDQLPQNFEELAEHIPEDMDDLEDFKVDYLDQLRELDDGEWEDWLGEFFNDDDDEEEEEESEEWKESWLGDEVMEDNDRKKRSRHGGHHGDGDGHHPPPPEGEHHGDEDWDDNTWFDWDEGDEDRMDDDYYDEEKEDDEWRRMYRTSVAMYSMALILGSIELIVVFASSITACCGLCKSPSQVTPQQVVVLQPGQQILPGANGQFVLVNAGYGQDVNIYHGARPLTLSADVTPSTNPALTVKPSGLPNGRLPPLATAPSYDEAVALPPKDEPAPEYQEAEELPTKISL